jgi:hypothetical protein
MMAFAQISAWGYGVVYRQPEALVHDKLVDYVHLVRSSSESVSLKGSASSKTTASPAQQAVGEEPSRAGMVARLLIAPSMGTNAALVNPNVTASIEEMLDPHVEQDNMKAFASIRTFPVPKALYSLGTWPLAVLWRGVRVGAHGCGGVCSLVPSCIAPCNAGEDVGHAAASGLANVTIKFNCSSGSYESDAWTHGELKFGPKLEPMTSIEQLDQALQSTRPTSLWWARST